MPALRLTLVFIPPDGDFTPKSYLGRIFVMGMIIVALVILPEQIAKIGWVLSHRSFWSCLPSQRQGLLPHVLTPDCTRQHRAVRTEMKVRGGRYKKHPLIGGATRHILVIVGAIDAK